MRLTISDAVRSRSLLVVPLGGSNTDQTTWCDLASTGTTVPFARPKPELRDGLLSLFTVSVINPGALFRARGYSVALLDTAADQLAFYPVEEAC